MKKNSSKRLLNRYSAWQYIVLVVTLVIMFFSAIPTWYGEDAAVQIGHTDNQLPSLTQIKQQLEQKDIAVKRIVQQPNKTTVVINDQQQQSATRVALLEMLNDSNHSATLTLALEPAAPKWLLNMGFEPIKLGLDLRGGVQFLLDVDVDQAFKLQTGQLKDQLQQQMRDEKIRGVRVTTPLNDTVRISFSNPQAKQSISHYIQTDYPQWQINTLSDTSIDITLKEQEKTLIRNLTVQQNLQTMRSRIEELGITEALVQRQGENRIRIELPGVQDPAAAKSVIGATASLAFYPVKTDASINSKVLLDRDGQPVHVTKQPILTGDHIVDARGSLDKMGMAEVNITLDSVGGKTMSHFSRSNIGKPMATAYSEYGRDSEGKTTQSNEIISVATIQSQLGSRFRITGSDSLQQAQELALLLRAGSLTAPVTIVEERTIGPTLGAENIENGFAALSLGLGMTLIFMALWYRRLGWIANIALVANMVILFGLLALIPGGVLTLPGIAGLVLTVGMAVDTNVLIFERIKDKLKEGRSFAQAIDRGFSSAFSTILDANVTTMITAIVLYSIGNGPIQGFALTLGLGLLTSMFTGVFASRALINLFWGRDSRHNVKV
ncbi:protein translocase subunit SecD [Aliivibrio kagoshimensis]|uniref:protein translocase subunit SecD n=1 Tax=Aliivibrio kagoshimensis TaxID=2910230 RepID=UPI003D0E7E53